MGEEYGDEVGVLIREHYEENTGQSDCFLSIA